jgi:hypothetical protein
MKFDGADKCTLGHTRSRTQSYGLSAVPPRAVLKYHQHTQTYTTPFVPFAIFKSSHTPPPAHRHHVSFPYFFLYLFYELATLTRSLYTHTHAPLHSQILLLLYYSCFVFFQMLNTDDNLPLTHTPNFVSLIFLLHTHTHTRPPFSTTPSCHTRSRYYNYHGSSSLIRMSVIVLLVSTSACTC